MVSESGMKLLMKKAEVYLKTIGLSETDTQCIVSLMKQDAINRGVYKENTDGKKMEDKEIAKLEEFYENLKHGISPCDLETWDFAHIRLNRKDASELKELLSVVMNQLESK